MPITYNLELIELARQGNPAAIEQLLSQCQPNLTRFAHTVCATPEDVEDAVQQTLWIASRKIGTLRTASAFATWIFRVVQRECYRLFRRAQHEVALDLVPETAWAVEGESHHPWFRHELVLALAQLPPAQRQVLLMRDVEEMTAPEVAATLGITIPTVKSRLHRARLALRASLQHWRA